MFLLSREYTGTHPAQDTIDRLWHAVALIHTKIKNEQKTNIYLN
jgi:hypothetical protein